MDLLSQLPLAIALLLASLWLYKQWRSTTQSHKLKLKSPPEPQGAWPLIGHLHLLSGQVPLARTLGAMADKYGPVFLFRLGVHPVLVVNNWESFKECFTTHDKTFASRPQSGACKLLCTSEAPLFRQYLTNIELVLNVIVLCIGFTDLYT
ncbi:hypothetical protein RHSIM_Rhsim01G0251200 [Rhododendron simsii]|uniref:Cytochrome P450 n=1 Tax=Rhododendron simsii TaxID=118357 RepID=A0A834HJU3_RHOSS|nr:hypothetical protein RHSIM_Rhsim01G0251200 [Rhododendron simsii]